MYMPSPYRMLVHTFLDELKRDALTVPRATRLIGADAIAHVPGKSGVAGDYHGPAGFVALFHRQREVAADGYDFEVQSYDVHHAAGAAVVQLGAKRQGITYRDSVRLVLSFEEGKVKELWLDPVDAAAFDAFFT